MQSKIVNGKRPCLECKKFKSMSEYYNDRANVSGKGYRCKACEKERTLRRTDHGDYHSSQYRADRKKKRMGTYAKRKLSLARYAIKNANKIKARAAVKNAIKLGSIVKLSCETCSDQISQAHHHAGYAKKNWLKITWLCKTHHYKTHGKTYGG